MGPIQTALGQMLGAASAATAIGTKLNENERQATEKEEKLAKREAEKAERKAEKEQKEADRKAERAEDNEIISKTLLEAQQNGTASPANILFDKSGKPLATYQEMAELLSSQRMSDSFTSRIRTMVATHERRKLLEAKKKAKEEEKNGQK